MQEIKKTPKQANPISEVITQALDDAKAQNTTTLKVSHLTSVTDYMVICTGSSNRHMRHLAESAIDAVQQSGREVLSTEGLDSDEWMIVDCGDAVLHVMSADAREFYHLEGLWDISETAEA
ncbi:ribosome silencing factor [Marinicella sp. S1101]|uniref:ribosome silencing factor n=1 Tax=Marinicella marina TaxID=2996016 RepID=UPI002260B48F|nr:ribosome silencing factor [Marinicella marina]MCX7553804.1 ribosome silencing factor [Marinicella marina]MDJ1140880.1 ribosome silencing factor [Marinicella marina]